MEDYTALIANNLIDEIQINLINQWGIGNVFEYLKLDSMIQDVRIIPDKYSDSNGFSTDFIYLSFRFPNEYNPMAYVKISEKLLTATHFPQIISKN